MELSWQDVVIGTGLWLLTTSVVPTIIDQHRKKTGLVPYGTSILISAVQLAITVAFVTLTYWVSAIPCAMLTILWGLVAWQKYHYRKWVLAECPRCKRKTGVHFGYVSYQCSNCRHMWSVA